MSIGCVLEKCCGAERDEGVFSEDVSAVKGGPRKDVLVRWNPFIKAAVAVYFFKAGDVESMVVGVSCKIVPKGDSWQRIGGNGRSKAGHQNSEIMCVGVGISGIVIEFQLLQKKLPCFKRRSAIVIPYL